MESGSYIKTFLKLLYTHLFIFIPPIAYIFGEIPHVILYRTRRIYDSYYYCGISMGEYIIKILADLLPTVTIVVTWLLFVYPSRVYMTEFYLYTWSGQHVAKIFLFFKSCNDSPGERCTAGTGGIRRISDAFHWNAPETHRKMEAVFQPELSRIFSDEFRPFPTRKHRELAGIP
jgi:hypothetical protein